MTNKEKNLLRELLWNDQDTILQALSYEYSDNDEEGFKERYGMTMAESEEVVKSIINKL